MEMMAGDAAGPWMRTEGGGGKDVLPWPLAGCTRPFAKQGFRHVDIARTDR